MALYLFDLSHPPPDTTALDLLSAIADRLEAIVEELSELKASLSLLLPHSAIVDRLEAVVEGISGLNANLCLLFSQKRKET